MGGSSGGGGGSSGKVDYPDYMKTQHEAWLTAIAADITTAQGASPYTGVSAYDPATDLTAMSTATGTFYTEVNALIADASLDKDALANAIDALLTMIALVDTGSEIGTLFSTLVSSVNSTTSDYLESSIGAFDNALTSAIRMNTLPKFEAGMRDINAVNSTAFIIGEAIIFAEKDRQVAKYAGDLAMKGVEISTRFVDVFMKAIEEKRNITTLLSDVYMKSLASLQAYTHYELERGRFSITANKEEADENLRIDVADSKWDLEVYQFGANMLAAIGGGTVSTANTEPSKFQTALGGALSGASAGSQIGGSFGGSGGGWGGIIGAAVGIGASFL